MGDLFLLGIGGFLGAIVRYGLSGFGQALSKTNQFPYGTLLVNVLGCFLIGVLAQMAESRGVVSAQQRLFAVTGFLGAMTTFSSFGLESVQLAQLGQGLMGMANVAANVVLCLGAVLAGKGLVLWLLR